MTLSSLGAGVIGAEIAREHSRYILNRKQRFAFEPNSIRLSAHWFAASSYIVDPVLLTTGLVTNAVANGAKLFLG